MKKFIQFDTFAKVFTVFGLIALLVYGIMVAGKAVTIMPTSEFDAMYYPSLEAKADTLHALKAQGQESSN